MMKLITARKAPSMEMLLPEETLCGSVFLSKINKEQGPVSVAKSLRAAYA
jgi:hypothetical protein